LNRLRINLSEEKKEALLRVFSMDSYPIIDYGTCRREEYIVRKLRTVFNGLVTVIHHYPVKTTKGLYIVDVYLKECNLVIEIDELQHRWNKEKEVE
jgi:hypothetical protein